ncbi:MAG: hypothetical protein OEY23_15595 [Acidimicrobiia bacterium]|nr:hypothetical protein [Acidimicrobiia bacterium]
MRRTAAAAAISFSLVSGTALGATVFGPNLVGAETATADATADANAPAPDAARPDPGAHLAETLAPLVADGTITQSQADAVVKALLAAHPDGPRGHHGHGFGRGPGGPAIETLTSVLGVDANALRQAMMDGKSIADLAAEQGVDVQAVVDALVTEAANHIDEAVTAGRLTADEAATKKADLAQRITARVNGDGPMGFGRGGPGHDHFGGADDHDDDDTTTDGGA